MTSTDILTIEHLLEERQWLSRLCQQLVRDAADADDIVQETMVRALAAPSASSAHASGRLKSWLATTGRNVASEMRLRSGRRVAREREVARPEALLPDMGSVMAAAELREQLARLVLTLPRSEREAVVLRYYENLSAEEIATRVGASSAAAVRQRIYRGLERLRASLDRDATESRRAWVPIALGLAQRAPDVPASTVPFGAGWAAMWVAAAAALLVAIGSVSSRGWHPEPPLAVNPIAAGEEHAAIPAPRLAPVPEGEKPEVARMALDRSPAALSGSRGRSFRILDPTTLLPLEGTDWFLRHTGDRDPQPFGVIDGGYLPPIAPVAAGTTGLDGMIHLPPLKPQLMQLVVETAKTHAGASFAIDGTRPGGEITDLVPPIGGSLAGVFVNAAGDPIEGAEVVEWTSEERLRTLGTTNASGEFRIDGIAPVARQFLRRDDGEVVSAWRTSSCYLIRRSEADPWVQFWNLLPENPPIGEGKVRNVGTIRAVEPVVVRGVVADASGKPVVGAIVAEKTMLSNTPAQRLRAITKPVAPFGPRPNSRVVESGDGGRFDLELALFGSRHLPNPTLIALGPGGTSAEVSVVLPEADELHEPVTFVLGTDVSVPIRLLDPTRPAAKPDLAGAETRFAAWRALDRLGRPHPRLRLPRLTWILDGSHVSIERGWLKDAGPITLEIEVPGYDPARVDVEMGSEEVTLLLTRRQRTRVQVRFTGEHVLPGQTASILVAGREPLSSHFPILFENRGAVPHELGLAGGLAMGVKDGDVIELAWPMDERGWIAAYPDEAGSFTLERPTVIGPLRLPREGAIVQFELLPWTTSATVVTPVLEGKDPVPVY